MVILIDTNIIIDFLVTREPFYNNAKEIMKKCASGELEGCIAFHTLPNLWYILRKTPEDKRREWLKDICSVLKVVGASHEDVVKAIQMNDFKDFEDYLQDRCAESAKATYIVTRNIEDYICAAVPAILPEHLLAKLIVD